MNAFEWQQRFETVSRRRSAAAAAPLAPVRTIQDTAAGRPLRAIGSDWSRAAFDGPFYQSPPHDGISMGVVFVRSRAGNTGADDPSSLGGGAVDEHLIYEGLSRVTVDGVAVGAGTLGRDSFFSVWRPELVELRARLGLPRHPAQIVLSADGSVAPDDVLLFNLPDVPVFVVTSDAGRARLVHAIHGRPWVTPVTGRSLREQFEIIRASGVHRIVSVGGRRSASALVDAGLVQDVYLTTTPSSAGEPGTPWYTGTRQLALKTIVVKEWDGEDGVVRFEHFVT